ncbi:hypothetical protein Pcinc_008889 [Petrolisthes cinctipes]|uniref:Uncharacterized protein n=1 Tax=Petrolisthes cinctipes TaxID=88211 RepID=A0AAE1G6C8_PETCI|nr:hypothetical protein Pcinc_008889 [Petrolisthes cinctipes]
MQVADFGQDANLTQINISRLVSHARQLRQASSCVMVVVMSDDLNFLNTFAESSLKGRLLVWSTRVLVVSRLYREDLGELFSTHWAFSMTNSMMINIDLFDHKPRYDIHTYLPYSPSGARLVRVASWTPTNGLFFHNALNMFPQKYGEYEALFNTLCISSDKVIAILI